MLVVSLKFNAQRTRPFMRKRATRMDARVKMVAVMVLRVS